MDLHVSRSHAVQHLRLALGAAATAYKLLLSARKAIKDGDTQSAIGLCDHAYDIGLEVSRAAENARDALCRMERLRKDAWEVRP